MALFKYLGEPLRRSLVKVYGPSDKIKIPMQDGTWNELPAPSRRGWRANDILSKDGSSYNFTDERALRCLRADPRFEEI